MANLITLSEPQVDTLIPAWTGLEIWHAATQGGAYSLLVQVPYIAHQITYTYDDAAGLSTDWYEVRRYGPGPTYSAYSPTWAVTLAAPTRRSLVTARRLLARKLGGYTLVRTDSTAPDAMSIVASDLAGGLDPDSYRQAWLYPTQTAGDPGAAAFKLRRAGNQALNTSTGQLATTVAWSAPIPSGVDVEINTLLPPVSHDKSDGLLSCLNQALAEMWTYTRLAVTGVNGQPAYDLSTANDWLEPGAINELYGPALDPTLNPQPWPGYATIQNSDSLKVGVSPTFSTGAAATVGVFRPADSWIKTSGVWGASEVGLVNDTDEHLFNPEVLVFVALAHAYHALGSQGEASERTQYLALEQRQRAKVGRWKLHGLARANHAMSHALPNSLGGGDPKSFDGMWGSGW